MEFQQFVGFIIFLSVFTMGFWLLIFLLTFVVPYWLVGYIKEEFKLKREAKKIRIKFLNINKLIRVDFCQPFFYSFSSCLSSNLSLLISPLRSFCASSFLIKPIGKH